MLLNTANGGADKLVYQQGRALLHNPPSGQVLIRNLPTAKNEHRPQSPRRPLPPPIESTETTSFQMAAPLSLNFPRIPGRLTWPGRVVGVWLRCG